MAVTTPFERLELARERGNATRNALMGFAQFHLPMRMRSKSVGEGGREAFELGAVFGNLLWSAALRDQFGPAAERCHLFLIAIPRFRRLLEDHEWAVMEWCETDYLAQREDGEEARRIEDTYRMIERGIWADAHAECREIGLVF